MYKYVILLIMLISAPAYSNSVKLTSYNPYSLSVKLEVKCDHNWKTKKFEYHKFFVVPGKKNVVFNVPNNLKDCQIWPTIKWW